MRKILIADNQPIFFEGLNQVLLKNFSFEQIDFVNDYYVLKLKITNTEYDLIILDHDAFAEVKPDILSELKQNNILIISACKNKDLINKYLKSPIAGYLMKDSSVDELILAIETCLKKEKFFSDYILDILLESNIKNNKGEVTVHLTQKEIEIITYISKGFTTKEIAGKINISHHTINTHKKNIFYKLSINNTSELIIYALKNCIIDLLEFSI